jgi:N-acetylglucosamine-6-phosphate deacetylase
MRIRVAIECATTLRRRDGRDGGASRHTWRRIVDMSNFIDLQINGCWGIDFNAAELSQHDWHLACKQLNDVGTSEFLPTIITDSLDSMVTKIQRLADYCERNREGEASATGIHVEGPFISPVTGYIGAHPRPHAIPASLDAAKQLVDAGRGWVRMVTLAPEMDRDASVVRYLADQRILVAAGHTNATIDELQQAIDGGLRCFTHLGNGCPAEMPRHDNIIHRVMKLRDQLTVTLIADGHHLPSWLLQIFIEWFGEDRAIIVSDAISAAGLPSGYHTLGNRRVWVGDDGVPRSEDRSHFVGSGALLDKMLPLLRDECRYSSSSLTKMFRENAKQLLDGVSPR